jgi:hypothetical protein
VLTAGAFALGDDAGPRRDVATIRRDLPILLAREVHERGGSPSGVRIDGVVASQGLALAQWHAGNLAAIAEMRFRLGRWWIDHQEPVPIPAGYYGWGCDNGLSAPFRALVPLAQAHLSAVNGMVERASQNAAGPRGTALCGVPNDTPLAGSIALPETPYAITIALARNDADPQAGFTGLADRAPALGESWLTPSSDAYAFFSGTVDAQHPIHVQAGTAIDVWFPFVLDPSLRYRLSIGTSLDSPVAVDVSGTLANNTLHFILPAFTLQPGEELLGEIDGDEPR